MPALTTAHQVSLPLKPPPQPDPADNWSYLRLALRPLDPSQLKDTLSTPEGELFVFSCFNFAGLFSLFFRRGFGNADPYVCLHCRVPHPVLVEA